MKAKLEQAVKKVVKNVLKNWGAYYFMPVQAGIGARTLDFLTCVPIRITEDMVGKTIGTFVAIETKREYVDKPTPKQAECMQQMRRAGGIAVLINSTKDIDVEDQIIWAIKNNTHETDNWLSLNSPYTKGEHNVL